MSLDAPKPVYFHVMEGGYLVEFAGPFQSLRVVSVCGNKEDITGWLRQGQIT